MEQYWWNSSGGKAMVGHLWLNTSGEIVMVESNGGTVMMEQ